MPDCAYISRLASLLILTVFVCGCSSGPPRIQQADVDIDKVVASVWDRCDRDESTLLSPEELLDYPSLGNRFSAIDSDQNGQLSRTELAGHLEAIFDPNVGLMSATCVVKRRGLGLKGARVRFEPEGFLSDYLPAAEGMVREDGITVLSVSEDDLPKGAPATKGLIRPGLYRVIITHSDDEIPKKYNLETELGQEVSGATIASGPFIIELEP